MNRNVLRRILARCVVALLLAPAALAVVLGLGGLLGALGDDVAAMACARVALALGVVLVLAVVATSATTALVLLAPPPPRRGRRRRGGRRRRERLAVDRPAGTA